MSTVHVAAGVVVDADGRILIAKRPRDKHQGGLWEFPGGKIESGETAEKALVRELQEEVGIHITAAEPLVTVRHSYSDKTVCLHVLRATEYTGTAWGREAQEILWIPPAELQNYAFPAANEPIVAAARLPRMLMITGAFTDEGDLHRRLQQGLDLGAGMVQFRAPWLSQEAYVAYAKLMHDWCRARGVPLIANCSLAAFEKIQCEGLHLTSSALQHVQARPVPKHLWLSAACHHAAEVAQAVAVGADFALLSPVKPTQSHADQPALGWSKFAEIVESAPLPVFALGGVGSAELPEAIARGAQGIAAISALWNR